METTYEECLSLVINALEEALEITEPDMQSISATPAVDPDDPDESLVVEITLERPAFSADYCKSRDITLSFCMAEGEADVSLLLGNNCKNPAMANEFLDRYEETTRFPSMWRPRYLAEAGSGLALHTRFAFESEQECYFKTVHCLSLLADERCTNEWRPFLHYFDA